MATRYLEFSDIPIETWLSSLVPVSVDEQSVSTIVLGRGVEAGTTMDEVEPRQRDLCKADLYMFCSLIPSTTGVTRDSDGGWSHSEGGSRMTADDKRALRRIAMRLYRKWDTVPDGGCQSSISITSHGFRMFR